MSITKTREFFSLPNVHYALTSIILQTHSKIILLTFLILTPNIMILITLKLIFQSLKNYYITSSKNLGTKLKNKHTTQVYNHQ